MTLREKQAQWVADFRLIEHPQERLAAMVDRGQRHATLPESECTEPRIVPGCVSTVWVRGQRAETLCHYHCAGQSSLVAGLAGILCELFSGHPAEEILATDLELIEALQLPRQLSPTRVNGLYQIHQAIRSFAQSPESAA